jgi:hypothetical protein
MAESRPPARPHRGAALLTGLVLVVAMTWPTVPGFTSVGRLDSGDGKFSIWNVGWVAHALLTDPRHVLDANIFSPHTGTLAYSELNLVAGVLGLPAYALTHSAIAATNAAILIGLLLSFLATWALVRRLTGSHEAGIVAGIAFTFCPYVQAHTPHIQLLMTFGVPLVLLAFHVFRDRPDLPRGAAVGAALALSGLACAYYGIFAGLALACLALCLARRDRRYWMGLAAALAVAAALVTPVFLPYLAARRAVGAASVMRVDEIRRWSASPAMYRSSPSNVHESLSPVLAPASESRFTGVLTHARAGGGVVHLGGRGTGGERRLAGAYLVLGLLAFWASFGPAAGLYDVLMHVVPAIGLLRAPSRFGLLVVAALAVLAGFGVRALTARRPRLVWAIAPLMALELASLPWSVVPRNPVVPRAYQYLASAPRGALVEFPFMYKRTDYAAHVDYMFNSTYHWQPLVNGYSDVIPEDFAKMAAAINGFPDPASFELMKRLHVKYVLWHFEAGPRGYDPVSREKVLARIPPYSAYLSRVTTSGDRWLYEITGYP